ncbi:CpsB/CapC family capsule biosynthesis tyrosine phosphatase [Sporosarcina sp.]|uniref:CpsB/CapC family capsule biosynthesis tyrosine phosphatase n=1 Tax=Sporosarcina sp. TaxID=49982 RepID=UPI002639EA2B|nr:CpsB/CapC family capsule biosynthesis tyrosine phosphatase [Sporosarcina sp.]
MVIELSDQTLFKVKNRLPIGEKVHLEIGNEIQDYCNLVKRIKINLLPVATNEKYMFIKFPHHEVPSSASTTFYEIQLLGYIPIIVNAEVNSDLRSNPNKLYTLVAKGALVQIDEASLIGKKGKVIRKFVNKLCKHNLVHFVSSDEVFEEDHFFSEITHRYLRKKFSHEYLNYLLDNAKHVRNGTFFHAIKPIKF